MEANPYQTPQSDPSLRRQNRPYQPKFFSLSGRLGRLRFLAYSMGLYCLAFLPLIIILPGIMTDSQNTTMPGVISLVTGVITIIVAIGAVIFTRRRLNDLNRSGWWQLIGIIPIINLIFYLYLLFFSGEKDANRFGAPPTKNSLLVKIIGVLAILIPFIGILAAVTIPAYQDYVERSSTLIQNN